MSEYITPHLKISEFIKESALCTSFIITLTHSDMVNTYACCELMYVLQGWPQPKV